MRSNSQRSYLHIQMGQEVIYVLLTCALVSALVMFVYSAKIRGEGDRLAVQLNSMEVDLTTQESETDLLRSRLANAEREVNEYKRNQSYPEQRIASLQEELTKLKKESDLLRRIKNPANVNDQPPIISLTESEGYSFPTGSSIVGEQFRARIQKEIVPMLLKLTEKYGTDVIEVVGHTDEVPIGAGMKVRSNLDYSLVDALNGKTDPGLLVAYDNVGLGIARAAAVRMILMSSGLESRFIIIPLSAGPAITTNGLVSSGVSIKLGEDARRRIEIRMRRRQAPGSLIRKSS